MSVYMQIIGTLLQENTDLSGNSIGPSLSDKSAYIKKVASSVYTIPCQYSLQDEQSSAWAKSILNALKPKSVVVLGSFKVGIWKNYPSVDVYNNL